MTEDYLFFEVYYGGKVQHDLDLFSFFEIERFLKKYGYKLVDLIYYLLRDSSLKNGLRCFILSRCAAND